MILLTVEEIIELHDKLISLGLSVADGSKDYDGILTWIIEHKF